MKKGSNINICEMSCEGSACIVVEHADRFGKQTPMHRSLSSLTSSRWSRGKVRDKQADECMN